MPTTRLSRKEWEIVEKIMALPKAKRQRILHTLETLSMPTEKDPSLELLALLLPPAKWQRLRCALLEEIDREKRLKVAEERLRRLSRERGLDWDKMSEQDREDFIDQLIHEDKDVNQDSGGI